MGGGAVRHYFGVLGRKEDQLVECRRALIAGLAELHLSATLVGAAAAHEARLAAIEAAEAQQRAISGVAANGELLRGLVDARTRELIAICSKHGLNLAGVAAGVQGVASDVQGVAGGVYAIRAILAGLHLSPPPRGCLPIRCRAGHGAAPPLREALL